MSAHCDKCGSDLVFGTGENWQAMECPRCEIEGKYDRLLSAAKQAVHRIGDAEHNEDWGDDFEAEVSLARTDLISVLQSLEGK